MNFNDKKVSKVEPVEAVGWKSRCTWKAQRLNGYSQAQVHKFNPFRAELSLRSFDIHDSILETIGQTPLVRMDNIAAKYNLQCELLGKCEFLNPGGSIKDRIAYRMIIEAENEGRLKPHSGYTIIEPTSGNTGIGLALCAAVRGYRCIIVMPEKMSQEKERALKVLGAEIVRTRTEANYNDPDSHISMANEICLKLPKSVILNQYRAPANPIAHYDSTAEEILKACGDQVDAIVAGAGTGGTICGIGRKFKEKMPHCLIVGADPIGSIIAEPEELNKAESSFYNVEGIGYDFIPTVLDRSVVDRWFKTSDKESFEKARELIRLEALLVGGSSGAAMAAALRAIKELDLNHRGKRVVVLLPDGIRNYMSKFVDDVWMCNNKFIVETKENGTTK